MGLGAGWGAHPPRAHVGAQPPRGPGCSRTSPAVAALSAGQQRTDTGAGRDTVRAGSKASRETSTGAGRGPGQTPGHPAQHRDREQTPSEEDPGGSWGVKPAANLSGRQAELQNPIGDQHQKLGWDLDAAKLNVGRGPGANPSGGHTAQQVGWKNFHMGPGPGQTPLGTKPGGTNPSRIKPGTSWAANPLVEPGPGAKPRRPGRAVSRVRTQKPPGTGRTPPRTGCKRDADSIAPPKPPNPTDPPCKPFRGSRLLQIPLGTGASLRTLRVPPPLSSPPPYTHSAGAAPRKRRGGGSGPSGSAPEQRGGNGRP